MTQPRATTRASRARGALLGLTAGGEALLDLATILGEELLAPELDLGRAVGRWTGVLAAPHDLPADVAAALGRLRDRGAPPPPGDPGGAAGLAVHVLPVALLTAEAPANLLSGSWHLAALTHPSAEATWAAVALNVAIARLLQGHRDFVADLTEALRSNDAPDAVLGRVRRLPVTRREELVPGAPDAARALETVLWLSWHEPRPLRGLEWLTAEGAPAATLAAAASLYGAHRGEEALAERLLLSPARRASVVALADRLARVNPAA
ncbi:MAG TPA: ADP-ribosylglycohydrolase family protein [Gemmatimonadales bacterium]|nr:ADP-ribosylglycohydrolase family protein [Gemmatimonadales bacterium]